jgi:hypothetical protein
MKNILFTTIVLLSSIINVFSQNIAVREYQDFFGSGILLKQDGTFSYFFNFDLIHKWTIGSWVGSDTLVLTSQPIYDTVVVINPITGMYSDSLLLSWDTISSSISKEELLHIPPYGQEPWDEPTSFLIRKNRLYILKPNGKPLTKRNHGIWTKRKLPSYYFKIQE